MTKTTTWITVIGLILACSADGRACTNGGADSPGTRFG